MGLNDGKAPWQVQHCGGKTPQLLQGLQHGGKTGFQKVQQHGGKFPFQQGLQSGGRTCDQPGQQPGGRSGLQRVQQRDGVSPPQRDLQHGGRSHDLLVQQHGGIAPWQVQLSQVVQQLLPWRPGGRHGRRQQRARQRGPRRH